MTNRRNITSLVAACLLVGGIWVSLTSDALAGLQGYWNFDEGAGTSAADSAKSNNGTLQGANLPVWTTGHTGEAGDSALDFLGEMGTAGTKTHVLVPNSADLQITGDQTISLWMRPLARAGTDAGGLDVDYGPIGAGSVGFGRQNPWNKAYGGEGTWTVETNASINYYYGGSGANALPYIGTNSGGGLVTASSWDMYTMVRDLDGSGTGSIYWYKNGLLASSPAATIDPAVAGAANLLIGWGYSKTFDGEIDDAAVWNEALTVPEITSMYQLSTGPTNALRELDYQLDDLDMLWGIYGDGPGSSGLVGGKTWNYVAGIDASGRVLGEAWEVAAAANSGQTGSNFFLLLNTFDNSGVMVGEIVPEPSSFMLLGLGVLGMMRHVRRRRRRA